MGVAGNSVELLRKLFRRSDLHNPPLVVAQGNSLYSSFGGSGHDILSGGGFGYRDYVRIEQDLISRYMDYEDMDEHPLVACLTGDTLVRTLDHGNVPIKRLSEMYPNGERFKVFAFDLRRGEFVIGYAHHPRRTKSDRIFEVLLDDGTKIKCTKDHKFLRWDGAWVEAKDLGTGDSLVKEAGLNNEVISVTDLGYEDDVYDLTTDDHHNFVANGVVVHNSALDIYADDALQHDKIHNKVIWVECEDESIRKDLNDLLHKRLNIEERIWGETRGLVKYGNAFSEVVARDKDGVLALNTLAPPTVRRIEVPAEIGSLGGRAFNSNETLGFLYDPRGAFRLSTDEFLQGLNARANGVSHSASGAAIFEGWEVIHSRLMGKHPDGLYGTGVPEGARWLFKRLVLLEDSIVLHRLTRAPSRHAFYIDVTSIPPQEVGAYLNRVKQGLKKQKFVNPNTGRMDSKFNPASGDEDFFLPVRDGKESTRVETLQGPVYDAIEDIKYFENKLFAALKVPKPFLTYEESTAKTNLSAEDSRFARTVMRIQREVRNGYHKLCRVHLAARGINPDAVEFSVNMTVPSAIFELAQLEIKNAELELADKFQAYAPKPWIMQNILGFSEDQIREMESLSDEREEADSDRPSMSGSSGALERALSQRGQRRSAPADDNEPPAEGRRFNGRVLLEQLSESRHKDKRLDQRLSRIEGVMRELQSSLRSK